MYIKKNIEYLMYTVLLCFVCISCAGCSSKNSGLYQLRTENETFANEQDGDSSGTEESVEDLPESDEQVVGPGILYVHVCGAVENPGVYEFSQGDRIFSAIDAAGGFSEDASMDYVNLAEELSDGMKIFIPTVDEVEELKQAGIEGIVTADMPETNQSGLININTADATLLTTLPGIGETRAAAIIAYRDAHGSFMKPEDITKVSGIGQSTYEKFKDQITTGT